MKITRRHILTTIATATLLGASALAQAADTVRIGLPTKTYWPTTIAETAVRQKLFEKEGIAAELTIYRGGNERHERMTAIDLHSVSSRSLFVCVPDFSGSSGRAAHLRNARGGELDEFLGRAEML